MLYDAIVTPYQKVLQEKAVTEAVRTRMLNVKTALIRYNNTNKKFPSSLDSLVLYVQTDSATVALSDSIFAEKPPYTFNIDSLIYSPRTGERFFYQLNDTLRPAIYMLKDPNSDDVIGDTLKTTSLNAASWQ